jgi:hypothetical protein
MWTAVVGISLLVFMVVIVRTVVKTIKRSLVRKSNYEYFINSSKYDNLQVIILYHGAEEIKGHANLFNVDPTRISKTSTIAMAR